MRKNEMLCKYCVETGKSNSFTGGNTNYRTSSLDRHCELPGHKQAIQDLRQRENMNTLCKKDLDKKSDVLIKAFKAVYFMAKEGIASSKYGAFMGFMESVGVDMGAINIGENATYSSRTSAEEMQESISEVIEGELVSKIWESPYISILTDESTDISNTKKLVIYVRILDPKTYVPSTHFFGNVTVEGSSCNHAEVLLVFDCICNFMKDKGVSLDNLIGFGSDGASVMTGNKSGVATRFRQLSPHMINIHCMAHRFNLCIYLASKDITYLKSTFEPVFRDIYYYFDKSANRAAELKELQKVLDGPQLKMKEVHDIRWLAFYQALNAVFHSWKTLVKYFQANQKTKQCQDLLSKITDYRFVALLYIMMDIIPHLSQLSLLLQKSELDIAAMGPALDQIVSTLKSVKDEKSYYQKQLQEHLKFTKSSTSSSSVTFYGVELLISRSTFKKQRMTLGK